MKNKLNEEVEPFRNRKCDSFDELKEKYFVYKNKYGNLITELHKGKNSEVAQLLNSSTKLVIVGSAIPYKLDFFYTGTNNYIYKWIDTVKNTNLQYCAIKKDIQLIKEKMADLKIVFLDLVDWCFNSSGSSKDNDVIAYTIDSVMFEKLRQLIIAQKENIKVISITHVVEETLDSLGIENEYCQLFPNKNLKQSWGDVETKWLYMLRKYI